jgi:hypothetical protein
VAESAAWTGFDLPAGATVRDTCQFYGVPSSFGGDVGSHVAKWRWGLGVGPLNPAVATQLRQTLAPSEWAALEPHVVGGVLRSDLLLGSTLTTGADGYSDQGIAIGYEIDGNFEIVAGGTGAYAALPREEVEVVEGGVVRAYYEIQFGPIGPAEVLTRDPGGY